VLFRSKVMVQDGKIFRSSRWSDADSPSGIGTEFTLGSADRVWLHLSVGPDLAYGTPSIQHGVPSAVGWTNFPNAVQYDDATDPDRIQTSFNLLLAYVKAYSATPSNPSFTSVITIAGNPYLLVQACNMNVRAC